MKALHASAATGEGAAPRSLLVLCLALALPMALPVLALVWLSWRGEAESWPHLFSTVLPPLIWPTILFCGLTAVLSLVIGTSMAWLATMYEFPARPYLKWMALLPLAMPGYIISFTYVDFLTYAGPLQSWLRQVMGWATPDDYMFPEIRSAQGAAVIMGFALYPYVYMSARAAFLRQPMNQLHVARTLGRNPWRAFASIALPQAQPAILIGVLIVLMECLNDIGAANFFGVRTLTIAIYGTWLDQGDLAGAAQLALLVVMAIGALLLAEQAARNRDALVRHGRTFMDLERHRLTGLAAMGASLVLFIPVFIGFILPGILLIGHAWRRRSGIFSENFLAAVSNSMMLAVLACIGTLILALVFAFAARQSDSALIRALQRFAGLGYAIPGTILGLGVLVPLSGLDHMFNAALAATIGWKPGLLLSGSVVALVFAYITRFLIIAISNIDTGLEKIPISFDHASRLLGRSPLKSFLSINLPLLRPAMITAALLVFVDAMKELPATLILRPFDFETLATQTFILASLGLLEDSALPALAIVAAGLLPVIALSRHLRDPARGK